MAKSKKKTKVTKVAKKAKRKVAKKRAATPATAAKRLGKSLKQLATDSLEVISSTFTNKNYAKKPSKN